MLLLHNPIQPYAWGRTDGLAELVGSAPTGGPEAELWVGAHPAAPSLVVGDPRGRTLADLIRDDPERWLGHDLVARGVTTLPFLLKVLAVGQPLSLQAHPSQSQAVAGFDREEAAGIPLDSPERNYRDTQAKPEALVALVDTWALCGFRPPAVAAELVGALRIDETRSLLGGLDGGGPEGLRVAMEWLLRLEVAQRGRFATAVARRSEQLASGAPGDPYHLVTELALHHPGDPGCLAPLLMAVLHLAPGEAVHLPAGNLHAYLSGAGVEVMGASDNVLRGGLTPKHVDVDELLSVLRFDTPGSEPPRRACPTPGITTYDCGEEAFAIAVVEPAPGGTRISPEGPALLLATGGPVHLSGPAGDMVLDGGAAAFVPPDHPPVTVSGAGRLWWATVGPTVVV